MRPVSAFIWILLGLTALTACQSSATEKSVQAVPTIPPLPELNVDEIALGKIVYDQYCAECHGANLEGEPDWKTQNSDGTFRSPPHTANGHTWHHDDAQLLEAIRLGGARFEGVNIGGSSNMTAFEGILTDEEITAVLTYIKSQWPEDTRSVQWEVTVQTNNQ